MRLKALADKDISTIDQAARTILKETGFIVPHEKMIEIFAGAGADVDRVGGRVRIPSLLVDECLARAGKSFTIYGRDRSKSAAFGQGQRNYNSAAGEASWLDRQGKRRF
ncbi:MAG TPA: hypothetical protein ENI27_02170, partial [bacterium]|nr:hypothetical protein [bacterium]